MFNFFINHQFLDSENQWDIAADCDSPSAVCDTTADWDTSSADCNTAADCDSLFAACDTVDGRNFASKKILSMEGFLHHLAGWCTQPQGAKFHTQAMSSEFI